MAASFDDFNNNFEDISSYNDEINGGHFQLRDPIINHDIPMPEQKFSDFKYRELLDKTYESLKKFGVMSSNPIFSVPVLVGITTIGVAIQSIQSPILRLLYATIAVLVTFEPSIILSALTLILTIFVDGGLSSKSNGRVILFLTSIIHFIVYYTSYLNNTSQWVFNGLILFVWFFVIVGEKQIRNSPHHFTYGGEIDDFNEC